MLKVFESELIKKTPEPINPDVMCKSVGYFKNEADPTNECIITLCNNVDLIITNEKSSYATPIPLGYKIYSCLLYPYNTDKTKNNYIVVDLFESKFKEVLDELLPLAELEYEGGFRSQAMDGCHIIN